VEAGATLFCQIPVVRQAHFNADFELGDISELSRIAHPNRNGSADSFVCCIADWQSAGVSLF
jgi:hypothetical protein